MDVMKRMPAYTFGGKPKGGKFSDAPGPGNYVPPDPSKYKESAPKYSIKGSGGHKFGGGGPDNPGPGAY